MTKEEIEAYVKKAREWVKENPMIAMGAAVTLGLLVGQLLGKKKTVYLEKAKK